MKQPEYLKFLIRNIYLRCSDFALKKQRDVIFEKRVVEGIYNIPIYVISYNRLSYVSQFVQQLERYHLTNIHIIDNCSTYPPLLEYYKNCPYDVIYMKENLGHMVFWKSDLFSEVRKDFYVVTDPDLEFVEACPDDFMEFLFQKLWKYPFVRKIGLSLKIDDLPENGCITKETLEWEKQYQKYYLKKDNLFIAGVDTTFALYLPDSLVKRQKFLRAFRTGMPYQMRHLPWYKTKEELTEEDYYYSVHKANGWFDPVKGFNPDDET